MARTIIAIFLGLALLLAALFAYTKLTGDDQPTVKPPDVTQKAEDLPSGEPLTLNETQILGLTFNLVDGGATYTLRADKLEYANLAETTQVTTVTVNGSISDYVHPTKFWLTPKRFQLLNQTGQAFAAKPTIKGKRGELTYTIVFSDVPVQALRDKEVNLLVEVAPVKTDEGTLRAEPVVIGVTPDRFREL